MSDSVRPHGRQPTRLPRPWDSPGKNAGVGAISFFNAKCMKVKSASEVAQSCPTLSDPMDGSPPGPPIQGIFQARVLEWGAIVFSVMYTKCLECTRRKPKSISHPCLLIYLSLRCKVGNIQNVLILHPSQTKPFEHCPA